MNEDGSNEVSLDAETDLTPLKVVALEAHEIYLELKYAGFPETMLASIMAHMLTDAILYGGSDYELVDEDDDDEFDEDEDEGNTKDGPN